MVRRSSPDAYLSPSRADLEKKRLIGEPLSSGGILEHLSMIDLVGDTIDHHQIFIARSEQSGQKHSDPVLVQSLNCHGDKFVERGDGHRSLAGLLRSCGRVCPDSPEGKIMTDILAQSSIPDAGCAVVFENNGRVAPEGVTGRGPSQQRLAVQT